MSKVKFEHHTGMQAYLWMFLHHDMKMKMDSIMIFESNLEVIVTDFGAVVAYRSDLPEDMQHMVQNSSKWCFTEDTEILLSKKDQSRLELLTNNYWWN